MSGVIAGGYNGAVRRLLPLLAAAWLALALAPAVLADDPRCADWEQHGAPPGIDMKALCTANQIIDTYTGRTRVDVTDEPLLPYAGAALVTGLALAVVGVLATRFVGAKAGRRLAPEIPDDWWTCSACQSVNAVGRPVCYACHQARPTSPAGEAPLLHRAD